MNKAKGERRKAKVGISRASDTRSVIGCVYGDGAAFGVRRRRVLLYLVAAFSSLSIYQSADLSAHSKTLPTALQPIENRSNNPRLWPFITFCFRLSPFAFRLLVAFCLLPFVFHLPVLAQVGGHLQTAPRNDGPPKLLRDVGIKQRLDEQVPLDLVFRDESGQAVQLGRYFGGKPVILSLVYYDCPMLCNQILNGLVSSLGILNFDVGKEFTVLTVSFDARETPELARAKKQGYIARYRRPGAAEGWHFLTGDQDSILRLTEAVGFEFAYDAETKQFAHASGIMVLTPQGKLARYFYGIEYAPKDLRLGLVEASQNKIGSPVDQVLLYCYHYDPTTGKYGLVVMNLIRMGGVITIIGLVALFLVLRKRDPSRRHARAGGTA